MAISGQVGAIYKASGAASAFTAQPLTNSGDNKRYFITDQTKRYWDKSQAVTVEKSTNGGSSWVIVTTGFDIEYAGGHVVFTADQGSAIFRASGSSFAAAQIGGGYNWSADIEVDMLDSTNFASNGWREMVPNYIGFSGSFEMFWANGNNLAELGNDIILVLYTDAGANKYRYEGYAKLSKDGIETPGDDLVKESLDFQGTGRLHYRAG